MTRRWKIILAVGVAAWGLLAAWTLTVALDARERADRARDSAWMAEEMAETTHVRADAAQMSADTVAYRVRELEFKAKWARIGERSARREHYATLPVRTLTQALKDRRGRPDFTSADYWALMWLTNHVRWGRGYTGSPDTTVSRVLAVARHDVKHGETGTEGRAAIAVLNRALSGS